MSETLRSVGLDVGTTTTQLIVSELVIENQAAGFSVPEMKITGRKILYKSPVYFTPMTDSTHVDAQGIEKIVDKEYEKAGICRESVDTGAIIITGETSRKENAGAVLNALSSFAGEFVVATAGPDLESVLAAKGAGATEFSRSTGKTVLHMDIGGGTSNLALIRDGEIVATGCLNVGGRLLKFDETGQITYVSPVLAGLTDLKVGDFPKLHQIQQVAKMLAEGLEMAAGLREPTHLLQHLRTAEAAEECPSPPGDTVISFSGGVADCIKAEQPPFAFGDMGPVLGQAIRNSRLCAGEYILGEETIRATVIGAGSHSAQLSGSTVFFQNVNLPLKNLPVAVFTRQEQEAEDLPERIVRRLREFDEKTVVLSMPGYTAPSYGQILRLADKIAEALAQKTAFLCFQGDMAKAMGHCLMLRLGPDMPCLCIDRVHLQAGSFLDVGQPVGPALPVVIKTLILERGIV